ncbi:MAG TPA: porin family protein [Hymenobacter sp.]|jgi:hypothetical protein
MKKYLVLLVLLSVGPLGWAQNIHFGIKAGANLGNGVGKDVQESKLRLAYHAGAVLNVGLGLLGDSILSIQPEVLYSVKGDQATATDSSINAQLTYIDVPVLLKANVGGLFFEAGPQFSFFRTAKPNASTSLNASTPVLTTTTPEYPKVGYGFAFGFGYQDEGGFNVGWRYSQDLSAITKSITDNTTRTTSEVQVRNSTLQFYVGYMFGHRKKSGKSSK